MIEQIKDYFFRGQFFGEVNILSNRIIQGWIYNLKAPDSSISIEVLKDGKTLGQTVADEFQPLLRSSKFCLLYTSPSPRDRG